MKRVLLTGMSGTGKSTLIRELTARGYKAIDTDDDGWSHWVNMRTGRPASPPAPGEHGWDELDWVWREDRIQSLLSIEDGDVLFLAGTAANQGKFYGLFVVASVKGQSEMSYGLLAGWWSIAGGDSCAQMKDYSVVAAASGS